MYGIAEIREKLNCTQAEVGFLINRNKNIINDAQQGHRKLSPEAADYILAIRLACNAKDAQAPDVVHIDDSGRELLAEANGKIISDCEFTLANKRRDFEIMKRQYEASVRALGYLNWIMDNPGNLDEKQRDWIRYRRDAEMTGLDKVGLVRQRELEIKIALLRCEIELRKQDLF